VTVPPPGKTQVQVGFALHGNGPADPVQVVVCPEQVTSVGQLVKVVIEVTVTVEFEYKVDDEDGAAEDSEFELLLLLELSEVELLELSELELSEDAEEEDKDAVDELLGGEVAQGI